MTRRTASPTGAVGLLALVALASSGCTGLAFRLDERLQIVEPKERARVSLPVTVRWTDEGIRPAAWAVFVDRSPQPHGKTTAWLGEDERGIIETLDTSVVLEVLASRLSVAPSARNDHEIIVVPLDAAGRRIGETAADVEITLVQP